MMLVGIGIPSEKAYSSLHHLHSIKSSSSSSSSDSWLEMTTLIRRRGRGRGSWSCSISSKYTAAPALLAAAVIFSSTTFLPPETLSNVPQTLSPDEDGKQARIQRPRSRKAESCTIKCVTTCIRGGAGSPGEGPLNVRRPLVVFKEGFRSRQYCLVECSEICNLIKDGEDGP